MPRILSHGRASFDEAVLFCADCAVAVSVANNVAADPLSKERREMNDAQDLVRRQWRKLQLNLLEVA